MKSPMIEHLYADEPEEMARFTDMQVCRSAAGYYVGTMYRDPQMGNMEVPGSRDSFEYFQRYEGAAEHLTLIEQGKAKSRMTP